MSVAPKKALGQHFLTDQNICKKIVAQYQNLAQSNNVIEVGPGMGAITKYLLEIEAINLELFEIDHESVSYLKENFSVLDGKIHS
ncbi:MAG TPA: rRNA adenine N-6-methyltransferase family protein, partial [Ignavibacteriaceae bacterium]